MTNREAVERATEAFNAHDVGALMLEQLGMSPAPEAA
jgi:hypothetical protein